jgi:hypothetical protein
MSLSFPSSPTVGDTYTASDNTWYWDGTKWRTYGIQGAIGPAGATGSAGNDLPKITGVTYADSGYTSNGASKILPSTAGYIYLTGSNFQSGCSVYVNGTLMTTTYVSSTRVNVAITGLSAASYHIYFYNPDGGTTVKVNGLSIVAPASTSGGTKTNSGSYTIHKFTTSGTFSLSGSSITADILVVAGGGAGGGSSPGGTYNGAGGGAGGLVYKPDHVFAVGSYTIEVGAGGTGGTVYGDNNSSGFDSYIYGVVTGKGGGKGGYNDAAAVSGGSGSGRTSVGGGGRYNDGSGTQPSQSGDSGTYGFGNSGGDTLFQYGESGGGGAGARGSNVSARYGGADGGIGKSYDISGTSTYYAGGGAGGGASGGNGGGGSGFYGTGAMGTANTGGGGAGGGGGNAGGSGGSGVVIIRYLT